MPLDFLWPLGLDYKCSYKVDGKPKLNLTKSVCKVRFALTYIYIYIYIII